MIIYVMLYSQCYTPLYLLLYVFSSLKKALHPKTSLMFLQLRYNIFQSLSLEDSIYTC
jgi:hypothetical protein